MAAEEPVQIWVIGSRRTVFRWWVLAINISPLRGLNGLGMLGFLPKGRSEGAGNFIMFLGCYKQVAPMEQNRVFFARRIEVESPDAEGQGSARTGSKGL